MTDESIDADECDALSGAALWGLVDWREEREPPFTGDVDVLDRAPEIGDDEDMGNAARVVCVAVSVIFLASSARQQPPPSSGGYTNFSSPSGGGGGCKKGCRCGNACIECSKTCHGGSTYRKRKR